MFEKEIKDLKEKRASVVKIQEDINDNTLVL